MVKKDLCVEKKECMYAWGKEGPMCGKEGVKRTLEQSMCGKEGVHVCVW